MGGNPRYTPAAGSTHVKLSAAPGMPRKIAEIAGNIQQEILYDDVLDEITNVWSLMGGCNNQPGPDDNDDGNDGDAGVGDSGSPDQQPRPKRAQLI